MSGQIHDVPAGALALAWSHVRQGRQVSIVSDGLSAGAAGRLGFVSFTSVSQALDDAFRRHGPNSEVSVLPRASETLPVYCPE